MDGVSPFAEQIPGVTTFTAGGDARVGFCDHTASGYYSTLRSASFWNGQGVSAHFAIAKDGRICQLVNIFDTAFAQGLLGPTVIWPPFVDMAHQNPNRYLISTEHEDETELNMVWPEAMYQADLKLKHWCVDEVKRVQGFNLLRFSLDSLAGHFMFDQVNRLHCPGTGWPRERLYADLTATKEKELSMATWAFLKDPPAGTPFRTYVVGMSADGPNAHFVPTLAEHQALEESRTAGPLVGLSIETLRAFGCTPDPLAP